MVCNFPFKIPKAINENIKTFRKFLQPTRPAKQIRKRNGKLFNVLQLQIGLVFKCTFYSTNANSPLSILVLTCKDVLLIYTSHIIILAGQRM